MVSIQKLSSEARINVGERPTLERVAYEGGWGRQRTAELYNMLYRHGPGNGTMLILPFDHLVGDGVGHTLGGENCADPRAVIELANRGNFSALALSIGQAEKYQNLLRPDLPLIIKVDGRYSTGREVESQAHYNMSTVERAVRAGANGIGALLSIGNENTEKDVARVSEIIDAAHQFGKPVFLWAYAHGPWPESMGTDSLYWCAQGVSAAESMGADVVKQKFPVPVKGERLNAYKENLLGITRDGELKKSFLKSKMAEVDQFLELEPADTANVPYELTVKRLSLLSKVAPNLLKGISGGLNRSEEEVLTTFRAVLDSGLEGQFPGRNFWARPTADALELNRRIVEVMSQDKYSRNLSEPRFTGKY